MIISKGADFLLVDSKGILKDSMNLLIRRASGDLELKTPSCTLPEFPPTGYSFSSPTLDRCTSTRCSSPVITGISCASGYEGEVTISECSTSSRDVILTGCQLRDEDLEPYLEVNKGVCANYLQSPKKCEKI